MTDREKHNESNKKYRLKHKDRLKEYYRNWYAKNGRSRNIDYIEAIVEWQKKHPEAIKAHRLLNYAVITGKVKKPKNCSECNKRKRLSAHHEDYSKPLIVLWLCSSCHKLKHPIDKN